jgi:zinc transporter
MNVSAAETEGLICAFQLSNAEELGPAVYATEPTGDAPLWIHLNLLDNRVRKYLAERANLDEEGRDLLLESDARVRVQPFPGGFAIVLADLHHDFKRDPEDFGTLRIYVDARRIITCRKHRVRSVDRVRQKLQAGAVGATPLDFFEELLDEIVTGFAATAMDLADWVENAEDKVLVGRATDQGSELGAMRRLLARLRRNLSANRTALVPLSHRIGDLCDADQRQRLREVIERLDAVAQDMELVTERARLLQEEIASRLTEATNRNLYVLSMVTTALLPITLVTGVFGMNVGGLPFLESDHGFLWVMVVMAFTIAATMVFLRRTKVL